MTDAFRFAAIRDVPSSAVTRNRGGWVFYDAFGNYAYVVMIRAPLDYLC
jgi:hypothetical protein